MEGEVFQTNPNEALTAHASVVCQVGECMQHCRPVQYTQGRIERFVVGQVVVAQWLDSQQLLALGLIPRGSLPFVLSYN